MLIKYKYFSIVWLSCVIIIAFKMYNSNQSIKMKNTKTGQSFPTTVNQFVENLSKSNVSLILIDPTYLLKLIDSNHKKILLNRKLLSEESIIENRINIANPRFISFAILEKDIQSFEAMLNMYANKKLKGYNGSKRHWNNTANDNSIAVPLHYLIYSNDIVIHITIFYTRKEFYWSGKLPSDVINELKSIETKISFGLHEQAFDKFNLKRILTADNIPYFIPDEIVHFISEIDSSRFIECDFQSTRVFSSNYEQILVESNYVNGKAFEAIIALKKLTKQLLLPFWISGGTLLGWFRQCGVIPYTEDIDCVTWARYASPDITHKFINNSVGLRLQFIYGLIENGYQYALYSQQSFRVDLFFMYNEGDNYTITGHIPTKNAYFRYIYPHFTLCSGELVGVKVLVPCNAELLIRTEYGLNWKIPKTFWSYVNSALNTGQVMYWTKEERSKIVYQEYFGHH